MISKEKKNALTGTQTNTVGLQRVLLVQHPSLATELASQTPWRINVLCFIFKLSKYIGFFR